MILHQEIKNGIRDLPDIKLECAEEFNVSKDFMEEVILDLKDLQESQRSRYDEMQYTYKDNSECRFNK